MSTAINTVTGTITPDELGRTLMHEHVYVEYGGAFNDTRDLGPRRNDIMAICADSVDQIKAYDVRTVVDPTPTDLGRRAPLMADLAAKTGLNIICCTGLYSVGTYLQVREQVGGPEAVADIFIQELTEGIGQTGVKAGIIKVVTGAPAISDAERELLQVSAKASVASGAPIITHTEGILGQEQQDILHAAGVPLHNIIVGHSCISTNFNYHMHMIRAGSYLGFDRFGMEGGMPDEVRVHSLIKLLEAGCAERMMVSHDSVWYWVGGPSLGSGGYQNWKPTNFFERIIPMLQYGGVTDEQIETMLVDNPRRFFTGEEPEAIS